MFRAPGSLWAIVSRAPTANPDRADLIAQRDAKAQELADLDALTPPEGETP